MKTTSKKRNYYNIKKFPGYILKVHLFSEIKKLIFAFPHHFLLVFCQQYFNNFCRNNLASSIKFFLVSLMEVFPMNAHNDPFFEKHKSIRFIRMLFIFIKRITSTKLESINQNHYLNSINQN